jgi:hypothetical protein
MTLLGEFNTPFPYAAAFRGLLYPDDEGILVIETSEPTHAETHRRIPDDLY